MSYSDNHHLSTKEYVKTFLKYLNDDHSTKCFTFAKKFAEEFLPLDKSKYADDLDSEELILLLTTAILYAFLKNITFMFLIFLMLYICYFLYYYIKVMVYLKNVSKII